MENDKIVPQCGRVTIDISTINGFSIDVIKACDLYMRLDMLCAYDVWLKNVTSQREVAKDFFYVYSENGLDCLFTIQAAKDITLESNASTSDGLLNCLQSYEREEKKSAFNNMLLSDTDKSVLVKKFAAAIGWAEKTVVLPTRTLLDMVDTIRLCKMHIDQIQTRLSKCDFLEVDDRK